MPFSSAGGKWITYFIPATNRASNNTPDAHVNTKNLFTRLDIKPTNNIGDHNMKYNANSILKIIVLNIRFTSFVWLKF